MAVFDAAVAKAYGGKTQDRLDGGARRREGLQAQEQLAARRDGRRPSATYLVGIKGPLTTPVGGGIRSLNVALRQMLDLYVCLRPVRYFKGVPSPVKAPGEGRHGDLPREHRGHLRGHRVRGRHPEAQKVLDFWAKEFPKEFNKIRFGTAKAGAEWQKQLEAIGMAKRDDAGEVGIGIKPVSQLGTERLVHARHRLRASSTSARA